jgi:cellulose 1,4-beta-cellobiosidase
MIKTSAKKGCWLFAVISYFVLLFSLAACPDDTTVFNSGPGENGGNEGDVGDGDGNEEGPHGPGQGGSGRVGNPFADANYYLNPDYQKSVDSSLARTNDEALKQKMEKIKKIPTAVWLDNRAAVTRTLASSGKMGLAEHLDAALAQAQADSSKKMLIALVIYDLPNRDCAALASNGELKLNGGSGSEQYQKEYIAPIVKILSAAKYRALRKVLIIEPDSLGNAVTNDHRISTPHFQQGAVGEHNNRDYPKCEPATIDAYLENVRYAIETLSAVANSYLYLDIGHSGWLAYDWMYPRIKEVYLEGLLNKTKCHGGKNGLDCIQGFATNVANYTPFEENPNVIDNYQQQMQSKFYDWGIVPDEKRFVEALTQGLKEGEKSISAIFPNKHFIVDTSRNGWPKDATPRDQRTHRGNWCNPSGAGIGERPQASPRADMPAIDAFFWVKPPGESDGVSESTAAPKDDPHKKFDEMCAPKAVARPYSNNMGIPTDALEGAPHAGMWFDEQFRMLIENATPPL